MKKNDGIFVIFFCKERKKIIVQDVTHLSIKRLPKNKVFIILVFRIMGMTVIDQ